MTVEWSVFSTLADKTVARFRTSARYEQNDPKKEGIDLAFQGAFARATGNLAEVSDFRQLIEKSASAPIEVASPISDAGNAERAPLVLPRIPLSRLRIEQTVGKVLSAVATIRVGGGHGSGFVVGRSGLLLTNQHVVGFAEKVEVVFANGLEVTGTVLRRDSVNDVALVQIPIRARNVLPIRTDLVRPLEDVYAVGSPLDANLQSTVTKGVVSAIRRFLPSAIRRIQADVPVSEGNSGGPLLDARGNVVGVTVSRHRDARAQNLNFFIPITDVLDVLGIQLEPTRTSMRK